MLIKLNEEAVRQLEWLMSRTGYTNHRHTMHVMLSSVKNNLVRIDKKNSPA